MKRLRKRNEKRERGRTAYHFLTQGKEKKREKEKKGKVGK